MDKLNNTPPSDTTESQKEFQWYNLGMTPLERLKERLGFSREDWEESLVLTLSKRYWEDLVGPILSRKSYPSSFQRGVLKIQVSHSAYGQEIQYLSHQILDSLQRKTGRRIVQKLEFKQGNLASPEFQKKPPPQVEPSLEGKEKLMEYVDKIEDEERRKALLELVSYL